MTSKNATRRQILAAASGAAVAAAVTSAKPAEAHESGNHWVGTWAGVPTAIPPVGMTVLENQTVRMVIHPSIAGDQLRVRLTNEFGEQPLAIAEAHIAHRSGTGASTDTVPGTDRRLTFGGRRTALLPAGTPIISDPVRLRVSSGTSLVVSLYLQQRTTVTTLAAFSFQDTAIAAGNVTAANHVTATTTLQQWFFLSGVSVAAGDDAAAIVTLGDSITNGANTQNNADHRWPDLLAQRLRDAGQRNRGIVNLGVSGNRLLHDPNPPAGSDAVAFAAYFGQSALRRFDRDVLAQPGRRYVIVLLGVNDLGHPGTVAPPSEVVSAEDLIGGHRQLIVRAHQAGMRIFGGTILPFKDDTLGFYSPENEQKRETVNRWIRTSGEYDGVVDFDKAMRDPADPLRLNAQYDSGDHLHPNDVGMIAMAAAVPLRFFK